jgi:hypothetical protein
MRTFVEKRSPFVDGSNLASQIFLPHRSNHPLPVVVSGVHTKRVIAAHPLSANTAKWNVIIGDGIRGGLR